MAYKNFRCTEIIEEIGEELRRIRKQKKQTISYVAERVAAASGLPVSSTLLGRIETGERRIDDEIMDAICSYYGVLSRDIVIAASRKHIRRLAGTAAADSGPEDIGTTLVSLFENLNEAGQKEVLSLMQLMAYMDAYKIRDYAVSENGEIVETDSESEG